MTVVVEAAPARTRSSLVSAPIDELSHRMQRFREIRDEAHVTGADSERSRTLIPTEAEHPFRTKPNTDSEASRTPSGGRRPRSKRRDDRERQVETDSKSTRGGGGVDACGATIDAQDSRDASTTVGTETLAA